MENRKARIISMEITEDIKKAIRHYMRDNRTPGSGLANMLELAPTTVTRWLSGSSQSISWESWSKLEPLIKKYLDSEPEETEAKDNQSTIFMEWFASLSSDERIDFVKNAIQTTKDPSLKAKLVELLRP